MTTKTIVIEIENKLLFPETGDIDALIDRRVTLEITGAIVAGIDANIGESARVRAGGRVQNRQRDSSVKVSIKARKVTLSAAVDPDPEPIIPV